MQVQTSSKTPEKVIGNGDLDGYFGATDTLIQQLRLPFGTSQADTFKIGTICFSRQQFLRPSARHTIIFAAVMA